MVMAVDNGPLEAVIRRRTREALAAILDAKDDIGYLTDQDGTDLRRVILDEVNDLANLCIDLIRVTEIDQGSLVNFDVISKIEEIHRAVVH